MKKIFLFIIPLILIVGAFSYLYVQYDKTKETTGLFFKDSSGELVPIEKYQESITNFDKKGSTNPAFRFRDISTGDVVYYFDHSGKILAYNLTLEENLKCSAPI